MSYFGSSVYDIGPSQGTPAIGTPVRNPKPGQDYIASGPGRLMPTIPQMIPSAFDEVTRHFGFHVYESMLSDPAVYSSFLALKLSILAGKIQVQPRVKPKGYRYTSPTDRKISPAKPGKSLSSEESVSQEVADFCERELGRLRVPPKTLLLQMLDCMAYGAKLSEGTREIAAGGPDKGKLVLKSVKVKPEWAWQYVVNAFMDVVGIITFVPPGLPGSDAASKSGGFLILPPEKFAIMTWLPKDNDPRGTSALRAAYDWWNLKQQVKPFYYGHLRRFGSPSLDGVLSENDTASSVDVDPATGREIPGTSITAAQRYVNQLIAFQNNAVVVRPAGSELNVIEPKSNGEAFLNGFDLFDRQICLAIGLQARASLEAKHGSKADSDTAENTRGLVIDYGRELCGHWLEKSLLYESVKINFGQDVADEYMACILIADTEAQDFATDLTAASGAGYTIGESQLEELDAKLGMPERDMEADKQAADDAMQKQQDMMAASGPPGDKGKDGGKPGDGKPAPSGRQEKGKPGKTVPKGAKQ